jgi:hypothetical protein
MTSAKDFAEHPGVFPPWTAYVMLLNIVLAFAWLAGGDNGGISADIVQRLGSFANSITRVVFAWYMLKSHFGSGFRIFKDYL